MPVLPIPTIKDKHEKFGRMLGIITMAGETVSVNQRAVDEGMAVVYLPK